MRYHYFEERAMEPLRYFIPFSMALFTSFLLLRGYEIISLTGNHEVPETIYRDNLLGILYDLVFTLQLSFAVLVFFGFFNFLHKRLGRIFNGLMLIIISLCCVGIIQYFVMTLVPLSADFWGYSLEDIQLTIGSSGGFSFGVMILLILTAAFSLTFYIIYRRLHFQSAVSGYVFFGLMVLSFAAIPLLPKPEHFDSDIDYYLAENKSRFFLMRSVDAFFGDDQMQEQIAVDIDFNKNEYPLLHKIDYKDVIGPHLNTDATLPNIVFVQVEGLGKAFVAGAPYSGFMPFLDSLANTGLFWENFVSSGGRTFAILPSMYGSLPFSKNGFMELGVNMPQHQTLLSLLKSRGYTTNFFYGGNLNFDKQDIFLEYQKVDYVLNEFKFPAGYQKMKPNSEGFSWGYGDKEVFNYSLSYLSGKNNSPRVDVYMTLTTHEPFRVPDPAYHGKFDLLVKKGVGAGKPVFEKYRNVFECLLYTDDALRDFISKYSRRPEFRNTIFVITGDHRMIPVPHLSAIDRFHVPFLIWSPMIKAPMRFRGVSSHHDVPVSVMALLQDQYGMQFPDTMAFIGKGLDTSPAFRSNLQQPIMQNKGDLNQMVYKEYFYTNGAVYRIKPGMALERVTNKETRAAVESELMKFKAINNYVCTNNKLYRKTGESEGTLMAYQLSPAESAFLQTQGADTLEIDEKFFLARKLTTRQKYSEAITFLKSTLNDSPNYTDVRILLGRSYLWSGDTASARKELTEAIRRNPDYYDGYMALADLELKNDNAVAAKRILDEGLRRVPNDKDLLDLKKSITP